MPRLICVLCLCLALAAPAAAMADGYYDYTAPERASIYNRRWSAPAVVATDPELAARAGADPAAAQALGHFNTGASAYAAGDYAAARDELKAGLALTQSFALWHNYGCALLQLEHAGAPLPVSRVYDPDEEDSYETEADPWAAQARHALDCAAGWRAYQGEPQAFDLLRARGDACFDTEEYEAALSAWQAAQAIPQGVADSDLAVNIATAMLRLDRYVEAEEGFRHALENEQQAGSVRADLLAKLGAAEYFNDKPEAALESTLQALTVLNAANIESPQLQQVLAGIYSTLGRNAEALAAAELSIRLRADRGWEEDRDLAALRGSALYDLQRWPEAADALLEAYGLYYRPSSFPELRELVLVLHSQGRTAEALKVFGREVTARKWSGDPAALLYAALAKFTAEHGDHAQALTDFETARRLAGSLGEVLSPEEEVAFSTVLEEAHRDAEAIAALQRAEAAALAAGRAPIPDYAWYRARLSLGQSDEAAVTREYLAGQRIVEEQDIELTADQHLLRGWFRLMNNEMQEALADATKAEELVRADGSEPSPNLLLLRAVILGLWGQHSASRALFDSPAMQQSDDPHFEAARLLLDGLVQMGTGERKAGCEKVRAALKMLADQGEPVAPESIAELLAPCPVE